MLCFMRSAHLCAVLWFLLSAPTSADTTAGIARSTRLRGEGGVSGCAEEEEDARLDGGRPLLLRAFDELLSRCLPIRAFYVWQMAPYATHYLPTIDYSR